MSEIKIFNDPVHGFLRIPRDIIFQLIEHPYFQRLRRIKQLGLTHMVYPGALHTRFHHALGALHLMQETIETLKSKGVSITEEESEAAGIAILLHDIGHGPFSHTLEHELTTNITHEELSLIFMQKLNQEFDYRLTTAIEIFKGNYHKHFLHQLVSSQLDLDRMDYLRRDSFYTGVSEGVIGADRIIKMLNVVDGHLVVEAKGIHSIENFLIARRLMYWQVYLHKTVVAAEELLIKIIQRARELTKKGEKLFASPSLYYFLTHPPDKKAFYDNSKVLDTFARLDDYDVIGSIKVWASHEDPVFAQLCNSLINRQLFKIEFSGQPFDEQKIQKLKKQVSQYYSIKEQDAEYFVFCKSLENQTYSHEEARINILFNDGTIQDITQATDQYELSIKNSRLKKYFLCYPKALTELNTIS